MNVCLDCPLLLGYNSTEPFQVAGMGQFWLTHDITDHKNC